jgi:carboxymethylenebutenolidase
MAARELIDLWERHVTGEFVAKDEDLSLATMTDDASVIHIPSQSGGKGKVELKAYYRDMFIPSIPDQWEYTMTKRVVAEETLVEEATVHLVHTKQMDWFLPGLPPTHKPIEVHLVIVVEYRDGKMAAERIYWDQASVLRQIGRL